MAVYNGGTGNDTYGGTADADTIFGNGGNDNLNGNVGDDSVNGGIGNDVVQGWFGNDTLVGGDGADTLLGYDGNDLLIAEGTGADLMSGGLGDDTFNLGAVTDLTGWVIDGGGDTDTVNLGTSLWLGSTTLPFAGIERLNVNGYVLYGTVGADFYDFSGITIGGYRLMLLTTDGNDTVIGPNTLMPYAHYIDAGVGNDSVAGGLNADEMYGRDGNDTLRGGGGNDSLFGGDDSDTTTDDVLDGGDGNDTISGGMFGSDVSFGGAGDDTIYTGLGINVADGESGIDTLDTTAWDEAYAIDLVTGATNYAGESYLNFEHLITGDGNDTLVGSASANRIQSGVGNDSIDGGSGNDTLDGGAGNDTLNGGGAGDSLIGGAGIDSMVGGGGNDNYTVTETGDLAVETSTLATEIDIVKSAVAYTLGANLENLTLTGSALIDGTGNALNNVLNGNGYANTLKGSGGNDALNGAGGADALYGGLGNDTLSGGGGLDTLKGEAGLDSYLFDTAPNTATNADTVTGFLAADDTFLMENGVYTALGAATGPLAAAKFRTGTAALDADDRIVYDAATGQLLYDADGNGAGSAVLFARVSAGTAITAADFVIV